jgi:hypothetical protein
VVGGAVLVAGLAALRASSMGDHACPGGSETITPVAVRLVPTVIRHRSWVDVRSADVRLGAKLLACTDGRLVGETLVTEEHLAMPITSIGIPTRWVAGTWLAGRLDEYQTTARWTIFVATR